MNKKGKQFIKTNNIFKLEKQIKPIHGKLANIRLNHIQDATNM
jgi:putative transposase